MGPAYGFPVWLGFDHLRFGLVVAVMRARPRE
jgi:hypothetical protein